MDAARAPRLSETKSLEIHAEADEDVIDSDFETFSSHPVDTMAPLWKRRRLYSPADSIIS